ncbi:uncharacterized protein G2W53_041139 [Senna tora]|uniref:Uncharacterized protein n=1 Tax=Senna tora TaxID=362788 RepID=A0A834SEC7_9FABA|nr:uncharacterized protein G2W53_041139 [Senna tora]
MPKAQEGEAQLGKGKEKVETSQEQVLRKSIRMEKPTWKISRRKD